MRQQKFELLSIMTIVIVSLYFSFTVAEGLTANPPRTLSELYNLEQNYKTGVFLKPPPPHIVMSKDITDVPVNDSCENAISLSSPFPVYGTGTTINATIDCPSLLYWQGVWYVINLPYEYNNITLTLCGLSEDMVDAGMYLMDDCACDDIINASIITPLEQSQCSTGYTGIMLEFNSIPSDINIENKIYWPVFAANDSYLPMDFAYTVDITEGEPPPMGDLCDNPFVIPSLPYSDSLNSCDFNNDYVFGGRDVVYQFELEDCAVVDISLCSTVEIFDSYMLLYDSSGCGEIPISTDDDACMPEGSYGTSRIIDTLEVGIYYICIDAYSGECGDYILEIDTSQCPVYGACCIEAECVATLLEQSCDSLGGTWYINEDCSQGFMCPGSCYEYLPGDANMANSTWPTQVIGGDVTYLVNYFRGLADPCLLGDFYCSADANGDCLVIGGDVTVLVNYFRGLTGLGHCSDFTPCWLSSQDLPSEMPSGWPNCEQ